MGDLIRKILWSILPSIHQKSIWTKNEEDIITLFKQYFLLNRTTEDEVETFLRNKHISFNTTKQNTSISQSSDEIRTILPGPPIWRGLLPYGSHYDVQLQFTDNVLLNIKVVLVEYHL